MDKEIKAKRHRVINSDIDSIVRQKFQRTLLCRAKPSYLLSLGPKASRSEYLNRLPGILRELLRKRNWSDASRVLSVLMKGTMKYPCPRMNRLKYEAHIHILNHSKNNKNKADEIGKQHEMERLLVWFEQICHFIEHGMNADAHSAAISLMQSRDFRMLPQANLFIGITFYKMWCSKFFKDLQHEDAESTKNISNKWESRSERVWRLSRPVPKSSCFN